MGSGFSNNQWLSYLLVILFTIMPVSNPVVSNNASMISMVEFLTIQIIHFPHDLLLLLRQHMRVNVSRDRNRAMTQQL